MSQNKLTQEANRFRHPDSMVVGAGYLAASKLLFLVTGYGIVMALTRLLTPEEFGVYGVVVGIVSTLSMVFITGTNQAVSKFVSQDPLNGEIVKRNAFKIQLFLGGGTVILFFVLSPSMANWLNDITLSRYLRIGSLILISYVMYAIFIGYLNGRKEFKKQALFDMAFGTMKMVFIILGTVISYSVAGAIGGFAAAAVIILLASFFIIGFQKTDQTSDWRPLLVFQLTIMGFALIRNLILQIDLILIKALADTSIANLQAGYYTASVSLARISYYLLISISYVLFPMVSQSTYQKDDQATKDIIKKGMRGTLLLVSVLAVLICSSAEGLITLLFTQKYSVAGNILFILTIGYFLFTLFYMCITLISASGRPNISVFFGSIVLVVEIIGCWFLIPRYSGMGAAIAMTIATMIGLLIAGGFVSKIMGALVEWRCLIRILSVAGLVFWSGTKFPVSGLQLIGKSLLLTLVYVGLLLAVGELTPKELSGIISHFRKK
jgi:O-antigen/teichoic acid export membrane protein